MTTVAVAVITHYLAPILVALLSPFVLKEKWRAQTFIALVLSMSGLALLLRPWSSEVNIEGALFGSASAVFFAAIVFTGKKLSGRFSSFELAAWPKISSLIVLWIAFPSGVSLEITPFGILIAGSLVCGAIPLVMYFRGLFAVRASTAGVLMLCEPLVAMMVGVFVWQEPLGALGVVGAGLILVGGVVIARGQREHVGQGTAADHIARNDASPDGG
jgi:drug/metabolite transporter, DME family